MTVFIGHNREARQAYGFDEVAIVPSTITVNPEEVDISTYLGPYKLQIPFLASAMDGVVDMKFAVEFSRLGGLAVLNLNGIYTRYDDYESVLNEIITAPQEKTTEIIQKIYKEPIKKNLIKKRIEEIKSNLPKDKICAVSTIPQNAPEFAKIAEESGADVFVVQATILTAKHISTKYQPLDIKKLCNELKIPVIVGNCVTYDAALELMETGCAGILVGVGPGSACTTREVLGIGVPQITATIDVAQARDFFLKKRGRYVSVITDGGMRTSGDICKAFVAGADAVMLGSIFARSKEAAGKGYHWGMAMPDFYLPRGTRIKVGVDATLEEILFGPSKKYDGTQNLVGALKTSMASVGAKTIKEFQLAKLIVAPEIKYEGKQLQREQKL